MIGSLERGETTTRVEAFVDGAFAFALTLLAIAGDHIPGSVAELIDAVKGIPAYALSFLLIVQFWSGHVEWSRTFGLDDGASRRLSLLLVFLVLVFVYPMKMVFGALFDGLSDGYFPAKFTIDSFGEVSALFVTFGIAFGSLGLTMWLLYAHAWRQRARLGLDAAECILARASMLCWALIPLIAAVSIVATLVIPGRRDSGWWIGFPGYVYFTLNIATPLILRAARRRAARVTSEAPA